MSNVIFFGEPWDAPILDDATQLPEVPWYAACLRCDEMIGEDDQGLVMPHIGDLDPRYLVGIGPGHSLIAIHWECHLAGIVGHLVRVCPCYGYDSSRETAREAQRRFDAGIDRIHRAVLDE